MDNKIKNISEVICAIPSKIDYMDKKSINNKDIHYFGVKPNPPTNWRDINKSNKNK